MVRLSRRSKRYGMSRSDLVLICAAVATVVVFGSLFLFSWLRSRDKAAPVPVVAGKAEAKAQSPAVAKKAPAPLVQTPFPGKAGSPNGFMGPLETGLTLAPQAQMPRETPFIPKELIPAYDLAQMALAAKDWKSALTVLEPAIPKAEKIAKTEPDPITASQYTSGLMMLLRMKAHALHNQGQSAQAVFDRMLKEWTWAEPGQLARLLIDQGVNQLAITPRAEGQAHSEGLKRAVKLFEQSRDGTPRGLLTKNGRYQRGCCPYPFCHRRRKLPGDGSAERASRRCGAETGVLTEQQKQASRRQGRAG